MKMDFLGNNQIYIEKKKKNKNDSGPKSSQGNLKYLINEEDLTAKVIGYKSKISNFYIPRSIKNESRE